MKQFLHSHPGAHTKPVVSGKPALHYLLDRGKVETGGLLVDEIEDKDLQIQDNETYTAFSYLANHNQPDVLELLKRMVARNKKLPDIGEYYSVPVVMASWKGFKDTTRYLYSVTDKNILDPKHGRDGVGVELLINCINIRLFDIATEIVTRFPKILEQPSREGVYPIHALAKSMSALKNGTRPKKSRAFRMNQWLSKSWKYSIEHVQRLLGGKESFEASDDIEKLVYNKALVFLQLVCVRVTSFDTSMLKSYVYEAMIEASKNGIVDFVSAMLIANSNLIRAKVEGKPLFWHAILNRQEKVYSLIYCFMPQKDYLLSYENRYNNNILHAVAMLPDIAAMGRMSSIPAMAMQREILWFEEVWSMANPRYRDELDDTNLTPRDLFALEHKDLINEGERAMKETANSAAFVGALILTVSFAAAFTIPGGIKSDGSPLFLDRALFKIFVVCDALSLYSAIASILAILGILTSSFAEIDFLFKSPRRLMVGLATLWFSLLTMMLGFCTVLALMLDGLFRYILPITLLVLTPVILFMSPIFPLCFEIYRSTYGTVLFEKNTKIRNRSEKNRKMQRGVDAKNLCAEENIILLNPSTADELV